MGDLKIAVLTQMTTSSQLQRCPHTHPTHTPHTPSLVIFLKLSILLLLLPELRDDKHALPTTTGGREEGRWCFGVEDELSTPLLQTDCSSGELVFSFPHLLLVFSPMTSRMITLEFSGSHTSDECRQEPEDDLELLPDPPASTS